MTQNVNGPLSDVKVVHVDSCYSYQSMEFYPLHLFKHTKAFKNAKRENHVYAPFGHLFSERVLSSGHFFLSSKMVGELV